MRIGIFGGTFDPPHHGHLILAAEALDQLRLDKILWTLTGDPPHKPDAPITQIPIFYRINKTTGIIARQKAAPING